jgi:hypothetical protein
MAKRVPREEAEEAAETPIIGADEFAKLVRKLTKEENDLLETKGRMGSAVANAVEKHNLHVDALRLYRKYAKKSPQAAAEFFLNLETYFLYGKLGQSVEPDMVETAATGKRGGPREPMGRGDMQVRGGKVVAIREAEAAEAEAAAG